MQKYLAFLENPQAVKMIDQVGDYFKDLPHLPPKVVKFLVQVAPFLALIGGIFSLLSSLSMLSITFSLHPIFRYSWVGFGGNYLIVTFVLAVLQAADALLLLLAFKPLKQRQKLGWLYLYYSILISVAVSLISLFISMAGLLSAVVWIVIDLYLIYDIRKSYK